MSLEDVGAESTRVLATEFTTRPSAMFAKLPQILFFVAQLALLQYLMWHMAFSVRKLRRLQVLGLYVTKKFIDHLQRDIARVPMTAEICQWNRQMIL
jgi:hypothetical protein